MNNTKVILDTNVLLVSVSSKSPYHWIFEKLIEGAFDLGITSEILLEYEESSLVNTALLWRRM